MCGENRLLELRERGGNEEWERKTAEMEKRKEGREGKGKGAELEQASSRQRRQTPEKRGRQRVKIWKRVFNDEERKGDNERETRDEKEGQMPTARTDCSR